MNLSPLPKLAFLDNNGRPLVGGLLFTYIAGTSTPQVTYTDRSGGTQNSNPVVLDFRGEANVWVDINLTYKYVLAPRGDTDPPTHPIWTVDNIAGALTLADLTQQVIGLILYPRTAAEISAGVTPTNYAIPSDDVIGYVDPRRYGADNTGVTNCQTQMQSAIAVLRKSASKRLYITGTYKITDMDLVDSYASSGTGGGDFNGGLTIIGDGVHVSKIHVVAAVNNTGVGVDMTGCGYWSIRDVFIYSDNGSSPKVLLLTAKGFQASAVVFSGNSSFDRMLLSSYGSFVWYNQSAESIDAHDCILQGLGSGSTSFCESRANTAGITSAYAPLDSPGNSTTAVSFTGFQSTLLSAGPQAVLLDVGASGGIGSIDFGTTYFALQGAATIAVTDNGTGTSVMSNVCMQNAKIELNGGAGTNQIVVLNSNRVQGCRFAGSSAYGTAQTSPLFVFAHGPETTTVDWTVNDSNLVGHPAVVIQCVAGSSQSTFKIDGPRSEITFGAAPVSTLLQCTDGIYSDGVHKFEGIATDSVTYDLQAFLFGASQGTNRDGWTRGQKTPSVSNAAAVVVLTFAIAGRARVTGIGSGKFFTEDVSFLYNTAPSVLTGSPVTSGTPAARTYTCVNNTLKLQMGDATAMDITVIADEVGAYGA